MCFKEIPLYAKNFQKNLRFPERFPESFDEVKATYVLSFMPMHILLVKLIIFRTEILILLIITIEQPLWVGLHLFDALLNHRHSLVIGCVTFIKPRQPLAIPILEMTFENSRQRKTLRHLYQPCSSHLLE